MASAAQPGICMTTPPTILSAQAIEDLMLKTTLNSWTPEQFARAIESAAITAYAAKLAQGVELEAVHYATVKCDSCNGRGHDGVFRYMDEFQPPEPSQCGDCGGSGVVEWPAVTLQSAQAAVAAERARAAGPLDIYEQRAIMQDVVSLRRLADYHDFKQCEADAMDSGCKGDEKRAAELRAIAQGICDEDPECWDDASPAPAPAAEPVPDQLQALQELADDAQKLGLGYGATPSPHPAPTAVPADRAELAWECKRLAWECKRLAGEYAIAIGQTVVAETEERIRARMAVATDLVQKLHAAIDRLASSAAQVPAARTDAEIVAQTEEVAALLADAFHGSLNAGTFRDSHNPKAALCWELACQIQELLTATDAKNAAAELAAAPAADENGSPNGH